MLSKLTNVLRNKFKKPHKLMRRNLQKKFVKNEFKTGPWEKRSKPARKTSSKSNGSSCASSPSSFSHVEEGYRRLNHGFRITGYR